MGRVAKGTVRGEKTRVGETVWEWWFCGRAGREGGRVMIE